MNLFKIYDHLLSQIYKFQDMGTYLVCGNANSRFGDLRDFIHGVDTVSEREIVDFKKNMFGQYLQELLLSSGTCILNDRKMSTKNDYTSISVNSLSGRLFNYSDRKPAAI